VKIVTPGRLLVAGLALLAVAVCLWVVPSRDYIFLPDRAHPVAPLVTVAGGHDPSDGGGIYFVDVIVRKASLLERLIPGLHHGASFYTPAEVNPPGVSDSDRRRLDQQEMRSSQQVAAAVALRSLGLRVKTVETGARITGVQPGLPADGKLKSGDVIVAVDGHNVRSPAAVTKAMSGKRVGEPVRFTVRRGRNSTVVTLKTAAAGDSKRAVVGIYLAPAERIELPRRVSIDSGDVGGPSAGLAFALDVLEELGQNVDRGHKIAATGEIFPNGEVGAIGGIKQKTIGAREAGVDAFLVPAGSNAREAQRYANGLRIIPVETFQQALHALATLRVKG
jgi:PDZ domain-containing protein